jgi:hypothetical protein
MNGLGCVVTLLKIHEVGHATHLIAKKAARRQGFGRAGSESRSCSHARIETRGNHYKNGRDYKKDNEVRTQTKFTLPASQHQRP